MSRLARLVQPGVAFHITARGNYRQDIFVNPADRSVYLEMLARNASIEKLKLLGWCLMSNHVHLLAIPETRESLARTMKRTQSSYSRWINRREDRSSGHLWQSRFYSCPLDGDAVWTALRYVEVNPVRAGVVAAAESSSWSSAAFHCGKGAAPPYLDMTLWWQLWNPIRWRSVLALGRDERLDATLREATQHGIPFGSPAFLDRMRQETGRDLTIRPVGRPKASVRRENLANSAVGGSA